MVLQSAEDFYIISYFWHLFKRTSLQDSDSKNKKKTDYYFLWPNFNCQFFSWLLSQYCPMSQTCVNCVSAFLCLFLNLFSKFPGGLRPRASIIKYHWILCITHVLFFFVTFTWLCMGCTFYLTENLKKTRRGRPLC